MKESTVFRYLSRFALMVVCALVITSAANAKSAAEYRRLADKCVKSGQYAQASEYYRQEAAIYRKLGDLNGAKAEELKAERWSTEIEVFVDAEPDRNVMLKNYTGAKHEPVYGCYLGAYLPYDERVKEISGSGLLEDGFAKMIDRRLSTSYLYCRYGQDFPLKWAKALCARGIAPHVAWEPGQGLDAVQNDEYLQKFARDAGSCGGPVFLRFAGEMNGDWTRWGRQPELFKAKFKLVHDVMEKYAPNVAMIWCVNHIPEHNITKYYPGDNYVDWVGVNFYSVIYHDNNLNRPAMFECPATFVKYVYMKYASKKPIAICEYGASHQDNNEECERTEYATKWIWQMLSSLPRLFPRVKLIDFFDCNNIENAMPSRQLNNYCLTDNDKVLESFKKAVAMDYFLTEVTNGKQSELPTHIKKLTSNAALTNTACLSAWVKSYDSNLTAIYSLDGKQIAKAKSPGEFRVDLDTAKYAKGKHTLKISVLDSKGRQAGSKVIPVVFR